ncbi:MAG: winged helix-turn-helix domain-containing protein [Promethearchaeota archaeon]
MNRQNNKTERKGISRRSKFEIWSELLEICTKTPRTQTWLRNNLGLKTSSVKEALRFLVARDLIQQVNNFGSIEFITTKKGTEALLQYYNLITNFFHEK